MQSKRIQITTFICALILFSCNPAKRATRFMHEHPDVAAEFCADEFPVKVNTDSSGFKESQARIDSIIKASQEEKEISQTERDQLINDIERMKSMPNPDCDSLSEAVYRLAAKEKSRADNLEKSNKALTNAAKNVKPIRDTIENTARVKAAELQTQAAIKDKEKLAAKLEQTQNDLDDMKGKRNWWRLACLITWGFCGLYTFYKLKIFFTQLKFLL